MINPSNKNKTAVAASLLGLLLGFGATNQAYAEYCITPVYEALQTVTACKSQIYSDSCKKSAVVARRSDSGLPELVQRCRVETLWPFECALAKGEHLEKCEKIKAVS